MGPQLFLFTLVYMCTVIVFSMTLTSKMRKDTQKGARSLGKECDIADGMHFYSNH